ncbi:hypothetical protein ABK046_52505, partial [Streptomyces caeruleatus]
RAEERQRDALRETRQREGRRRRVLGMPQQRLVPWRRRQRTVDALKTVKANNPGRIRTDVPFMR